jgi:gliding motility-associated lipoprotein GldH
MKLSGFIFLAVLTLTGCVRTNDVYEKMYFFPKHEWSSNVKPSFNFEVADTTAMYRLYFVIRHSDAYHFNNIWVNLSVKSPDSTIVIKREFTLADAQKWHGTTIDDIVEQRIPFDKNNTPVPLKKGNYTFTLQQAMREDPLQRVLNAGIRVEKVQ